MSTSSAHFAFPDDDDDMGKIPPPPESNDTVQRSSGKKKKKQGRSSPRRSRNHKSERTTTEGTTTVPPRKPLSPRDQLPPVSKEEEEEDEAGFSACSNQDGGEELDEELLYSVSRFIDHLQYRSVEALRSKSDEENARGGEKKNPSTINGGGAAGADGIEIDDVAVDESTLRKVNRFISVLQHKDEDLAEELDLLVKSMSSDSLDSVPLKPDAIAAIGEFIDELSGKCNNNKNNNVISARSVEELNETIIKAESSSDAAADDDDDITSVRTPDADNPEKATTSIMSTSNSNSKSTHPSRSSVVQGLNEAIGAEPGENTSVKSGDLPPEALSVLRQYVDMVNGASFDDGDDDHNNKEDLVNNSDDGDDDHNNKEDLVNNSASFDDDHHNNKEDLVNGASFDDRKEDPPTTNNSVDGDLDDDESNGQDDALSGSRSNDETGHSDVDMVNNGGPFEQKEDPPTSIGQSSSSVDDQLHDETNDQVLLSGSRSTDEGGHSVIAEEETTTPAPPFLAPFVVSKNNEEVDPLDKHDPPTSPEQEMFKEDPPSFLSPSEEDARYSGEPEMNPKKAEGGGRSTCSSSRDPELSKPMMIDTVGERKNTSRDPELKKSSLMIDTTGELNYKDVDTCEDTPGSVKADSESPALVEDEQEKDDVSYQPSDEKTDDGSSLGYLEEQNEKEEDAERSSEEKEEEDAEESSEEKKEEDEDVGSFEQKNSEDGANDLAPFVYPENNDAQAGSKNDGSFEQKDVEDGVNDPAAFAHPENNDAETGSKNDGSFEQKNAEDGVNEQPNVRSETMRRLYVRLVESVETSDEELDKFEELVQLAFPYMDGRLLTAKTRARIQIKARKKKIPVALTRSFLEVVDRLYKETPPLFTDPLSREEKIELLISCILAEKEVELRRVTIYNVADSNEEEAFEVGIDGEFDYAFAAYECNSQSDNSDGAPWWQTEAASKSASAECNQQDLDECDTKQEEDLTDGKTEAPGDSMKQTPSLEEDINDFWKGQKEMKENQGFQPKLVLKQSKEWTPSEHGPASPSRTSPSRSFESNEMFWVRKQTMATWPKKSPHHWTSDGKALEVPEPDSIDAVAVTTEFEHPSFLKKRGRLPKTNQWRLPYAARTKSHTGYFDADVNSLYVATEVGARCHRHDLLPWEHRDVKQRFLQEQSISYNRNWFGTTQKWYGNSKIFQPVCRPKSMEMPMSAGEWTEEWYRKPWQNLSGSAGSEMKEICRRYNIGEEFEDDNVSWENTPECGTFRNVKQKIGERISRVTPYHTSSLRRSRWRKKYFPKGTFPY